MPEKRRLRIAEKRETVKDSDIYERVFEFAGDAIFVHDYEGRISRVNETACRMLGYSRSHLEGMSVLEVDAYPSRERMEQFLRDLDEAQDLRFETEHVSRNGERIPVEVHSTPIQYGGRRLVLSMARDISERKLVEESLRGLSRTALDFITAESREQLYREVCTSLMKELPEALVFLAVYEAESNLMVVRETAGLDAEVRERLARFGVVPEALFFRPGEEDRRDYMEGKSHFIDLIKFIRRYLGFSGELLEEFSRYIGRRQTLLVGLPGKSRLYGSLFIAYRGLQRQWQTRFIEAYAYQVAAALEHQSLLEQLRHEHRRAEEANKQKSVFLAGVSHEIRTPLNAVLGYTDILSQHLRSEGLRHYVDSIRASGKALLALVDDILDLSKIEAGRLEIEPEPLNLHHLLEELYHLFHETARNKGLQLTVALAPGLYECYQLDHSRLRQILINLTGNAIKYTPSGEVATVIYLEGEKEEGGVDLRIEVRDTGEGVPVELQSVIFEPYRQGMQGRQKSGVGLGLAITKELVEMMGGSINVENRPEGGAVFSVHLYDVPVAGTGTAEAGELAGCVWSDGEHVVETEGPRATASEGRTAAGGQVATPHQERTERSAADGEDEELLEQWRRIRKSGSFTEIAAFAEQLQQYGVARQNEELVSYGRSLASLVERFDVVRMRALLDDFPAATGMGQAREGGDEE